MKIREFPRLIGMLESGDLAEHVNQKLREVVLACQEAAGPKHEAKGKLTLELSIGVQGTNITFEGDVKTKTPKVKRPRSFYFVTAAGEIDTDHPTQMDMFPREVSRDHG